jgi:hypothetical protein
VGSAVTDGCAGGSAGGCGGGGERRNNQWAGGSDLERLLGVGN